MQRVRLIIGALAITVLFQNCGIRDEETYPKVALAAEQALMDEPTVELSILPQIKLTDISEITYRIRKNFRRDDPPTPGVLLVDKAHKIIFDHQLKRAQLNILFTSNRPVEPILKCPSISLDSTEYQNILNSLMQLSLTKGEAPVIGYGDVEVPVLDLYSTGLMIAKSFTGKIDLADQQHLEVLKNLHHLSSIISEIEATRCQ
jgi:hypothetical protein